MKVPGGRHRGCRLIWRREAARTKAAHPEIRPLKDFVITVYGDEDYAVFGPDDFFIEVDACCKYDARIQALRKYRDAQRKEE